MNTKTKHMLGIAIGAVALIALTAGASALITREVVEPEQKVTVTKTQTRKVAATAQPAPQPQQQQRCDDGNVVGYGLGALAGGLVGNQLGDGDGKKVATIGGAAAGALAGGQYIPTRGVLCPK